MTSNIVKPLSIIYDSPNTKNIEWFGFDKEEKYINGVRFLSDNSPLVIEVNQMNIFTKSIRSKKIFIENLPNEGHSLRSTRISPDGKIIGFIQFDHENETITVIFCLVSINNEEVKIYSFERENVHHELLQSIGGNTLLCTNNNEWIFKLNPNELYETTFEYRRIVLDNANFKARAEYITESYCHEAYGDPRQMLRDELFFDNKFVVFGRGADNQMYRLHVFDFQNQTWTRLFTSTAPDVPECKTNYRVFGTSMNNIVAISNDTGLILKYDEPTNTWYNTKMNLCLNLPSDCVEKSCLKDVFISSKFLFFLLWKENMEFRECRFGCDFNLPENQFNRYDHTYFYDHIYLLFNYFNVLSLKEICMFKLCGTNLPLGDTSFEEKIGPQIPVLLKQYFGI